MKPKDVELASGRMVFDLSNSTICVFLHFVGQRVSLRNRRRIGRYKAGNGPVFARPAGLTFRKAAPGPVP